MKFELTLENKEQIAREFLTFIKKNKAASNCFAFYGKMGSGKTTFIKEICNQFGVKEVVTSPTFAIINEYKSENSANIYHFDFYRINKIEEAYDLGCEDYFYSTNYCFIEWPELIEELLPENYVQINLVENNDKTRTLIITDTISFPT